MTTPAAAGNAGTNGTQGDGANSGNSSTGATATQTTTQQATEGKTTLAAELGATATQTNAPAPIDYDKLDLKKPEGYKGTDADLAFVRAAAKAAGVSAEAAQKLLDHHAATIASEEAAIQREIEQTRNDHIAALKSDPEFGGAKFSESITKADQFLAKYDPEGKLIGKLKQFGLEHEPDLVRVFMRAAAASSEGKFIQSGKQPEASRSATAEEMYDVRLRR